ncbi:TRAP-type C4-dicarboxylate transport system, small permease component [Thermanaeromonas toyohensis ToBE]|uniref:TRAP-type C4-dicarboxylate transport system, small permease component n=1 Tax=Thermanaeromonas toyohensis ToBE TaxID=698762 RepID=A0A1W1W0F3_9FIRM|nr:TRAP transporter small permease [Thermanaeromonas toyohensis]SMB98993.1 TRAP-type C4-dicarboxylate transport system, small permease component [Thermanaeromonas toyohensis ToBE]
MLIKIVQFGHRILEYVSAILLGLMVIVVFTNVLSRYFLNFSLAFTEELSRFIFLWIVFIGSLLALIRNEHLGIDILIMRFPPRIREYFLLFDDLLAGIAVLIIFIGGIRLTKGNFSWPAPATGIPYGIVESIIPIMSIAMVLILTARIIGKVSALACSRGVKR